MSKGSQYLKGALAKLVVTSMAAAICLELLLSDEIDDPVGLLSQKHSMFSARTMSDPVTKSFVMVRR